MFDIVCRRLVWKEFRTQWQIALSLLVGAWLLQGLVLLQSLHLGPEYPITVGLVLTACFAVTSGAILFAGEREEQTDDWLRQLPLSGRQLVTGKLAFLIVAAALFGLMVIGSGLLLIPVARRAESVGLPFAQSLREQTASFTVAILALGAWSVFYSLRLRHVMAVVVAAPVTHLLVAGVVSNFTTGSSHLTWLLSLAAVVMLFDVVLAQSWLVGRSDLPWMSLPGTSTSHWTAAERQRRVWQRLLSMAATRSPLGQRTVLVLLWRELRTAVPFALLWGLFGVLMVAVLVRLWFDGTNLVWLMATPVVCGLMTCLGDNRRQTYRFLADRGLSPGMVWLTKHAVWMLLCVGLLLSFGLYDEITASASRSHPLSSRSFDGVWRMLGQLAGSVLRSSPTLTGFSEVESAIHWRQVSLACSLGLLLYGVGHLCALWFRRVVVAASVAGLMGVLLFAWHAIVSVSDIPLAYTTWPLVLTAIAASLLTVEGWLVERSGWRPKVLRAGIVLAPLCGVAVAANQWRATQIPVVSPGFDWEQHWETINNSDPHWSNRWRMVFSDGRLHFGGDADAFVIRRWEDLLGRLQPAELAGEVDVPPDEAAGTASAGDPGGMGGDAGGFAADQRRLSAWDQLLDEDLRGYEILSELRSLADALMTQRPRISSRVLTEQSLFITTLGQIFVEAACQYRLRGDLDESWDVLAEGLRVTQYLSTQTIHARDLQDCWEAQRLILQEIHAWAAAPEQTPERLRLANETWWATLRDQASPSPDLTWMNRCAFYNHHLMNQDEAYVDQSSWSRSRPFWSFNTWWPERLRAVRLTTAITAGLMQSSRNDRLTAAYPFLNLRYVNDDIMPRDLSRWLATTLLTPPDFAASYFVDRRPLSSTRQATDVVLELHRQRVTLGHLPDSLPETVPFFARGGGPPCDLNFRSPLAGFAVSERSFGYAPGGFSLPTRVHHDHGLRSGFIVPAGTPLLWSRGQAGGDIVRSREGSHYSNQYRATRDAAFTLQFSDGTPRSDDPSESELAHQSGDAPPSSEPALTEDRVIEDLRNATVEAAKDAAKDVTPVADQAPPRHRLLFIILGGPQW